jgi:uncharacterized membrane protein YkvA (DUF1232 family)
MSAWAWGAIAAGTALAAYATLIVALIAAGRPRAARAVARLAPDCAVLFRRLAADSRVPRRHRLLLSAAAAYLLLPFDLVPDFIPVAGALDDAVVVALVLRAVLRGAGPLVVASHWPGPRESLRAMLRLAGLPALR